MHDADHGDREWANAQAVISAQYDLPLAGGGCDRSRGIDSARPAAETVHPQADMFYDNAQRALARMVEPDVTIDGDAANVAALERIEALLIGEQSFAIQIVDPWPRQERLADRYRPSFLIDCLVPTGRAQDIHANLDDIFPRWVERHGARKAGWIKSMQVLLLIGGTWWEKGLATAERLLKVARLSG